MITKTRYMKSKHHLKRRPNWKFQYVGVYDIYHPKARMLFKNVKGYSVLIPSLPPLDFDKHTAAQNAIAKINAMVGDTGAEIRKKKTAYVILWREIKAKTIKQPILKPKTPNRKKFFSPHKRKKDRPPHHPNIAFDTEDDGKGNFIMGWVIGEIGHKGKNHKKHEYVERFFTSKKEMAKFLNSLGGKNSIINGYNTIYDIANLEPYIECDKKFVGSRFVFGKNRNGARYYDVANHLTGGLAVLMPLVNMKKHDEKSTKEMSFEELKQRCYTDALATYKLACMLEDFYVENGTRYRATIGSSSLAMFQAKHLKNLWKTEGREELSKYERMAYRGGRVELFEKGEKKVKSYDINGTYVYILANFSFPHPNYAHIVKSDLNFEENFKRFEFGIVHAEVEVPEMKYAPLPFYDESKGKLIFPCGRFSGYWTFHEMRMAIKYGAKILKVLDYVFYTKSEKFFSEYAKWTWEQRQRWKGKNRFMEIMFKTLGNSLYGKFGEMNPKVSFFGKKSDFNLKLEIGATINEIDLNGQKYISFESSEKEDTNHTFPIIAAYTTSYARIMLFEEMVKHDVVYCDTDSLKITHGEIATSSDLGGWKLEGEYLFKGYAPKLYTENGQWKAKGVPKRARIELTENYLKASWVAPYKYKECLRRGLKFNEWTEHYKEVELTDDKREWNGEESKPIKCGS